MKEWNWSRTRSWRSGTRCPWRWASCFVLTRTRSWMTRLTSRVLKTPASRWGWSRTDLLPRMTRWPVGSWRHRLRVEVELNVRPRNDTLKSNWTSGFGKNVETPCNRMGFAITAGPETIVLTRLAKKVRFPVLSQERQSWLLAKECIEMNMKPFWLSVFSGRLNPDKNCWLDLNQMNGNSCENQYKVQSICSVDWQDYLC